MKQQTKQPPPRPHRKLCKKYYWFKGIISLLLATVGLFLLSSLIVAAFQIDIHVIRHRDMLPIFDVGDVAIITRLKRKPQPGDLVLFNLTRLNIGEDIVVRRIIYVQEHNESVRLMTKCEGLKVDDRFTYPRGKPWAENQQILGRVLVNLKRVGHLRLVYEEVAILRWTFNFVVVLFIFYIVKGA